MRSNSSDKMGGASNINLSGDITHKSIGQTNQDWEINRLQFIEQYKNELPIKVE